MLKSIVIDQYGNLRFHEMPNSPEVFTLLLLASRHLETEFPKVLAENGPVAPSAKDSLTNHYHLADGQYTVQWASDVTATLIVQQIDEDRRIHFRGLNGMDLTIGSGTAALPAPADIP